MAFWKTNKRTGGKFIVRKSFPRPTYTGKFRVFDQYKRPMNTHSVSYDPYMRAHGIWRKGKFYRDS